jgi:hypothetical protein
MPTPRAVDVEHGRGLDGDRDQQHRFAAGVVAQQRHELPPGALLRVQRATVRRVHRWHVLEADRDGRLLVVVDRLVVAFVMSVRGRPKLLGGVALALSIALYIPLW